MWWDYEIGYPLSKPNPYNNLLIIGGILGLVGLAYFYTNKSSK